MSAPPSLKKVLHIATPFDLIILFFAKNQQESYRSK